MVAGGYLRTAMSGKQHTYVAKHCELVSCGRRTVHAADTFLLAVERRVGRGWELGRHHGRKKATCGCFGGV